MKPTKQAHANQEKNSMSTDGVYGSEETNPSKKNTTRKESKSPTGDDTKNETEKARAKIKSKS